MANNNEYIQQLVDAILVVAEAQREGKHTDGLRETFLKSVAQRQGQGTVGKSVSYLAKEDTGAISKGDAMIGISGAIAQKIAKEVGALLSEIFASIAAEARSVVTDRGKAIHQTPMEMTKEYARDLAIAGQKVTPEKLSKFWKRNVELGTRISDAETMAMGTASRLPSAAVNMEANVYDWYNKEMGNLKRYADRHFQIEQNNNLHDDMGGGG